jgi:hypothetical protein
MRSTILAFSAIFALASAQTPSSGPSPIGAIIPIGQPCVPGGTMCALGGSCYATNSGLQTICGNFQAQCTSNQQCAFNTCNGGFCNGVLSSVSPSASPTPIGAVIPVGGDCNPYQGATPCALGSQCYATNSGLQTRCGNFQAQCTSNQQCAFNTCNNGFCNGLLSSSVPSSSSPAARSSSGAPSVSSKPAVVTPPAGGNATITRTPSVVPTGPAASRTSAAVFTGAASIINVKGRAIAIIFGSLAFAL